MAFCSKCGSEIPEGTAFCPKCGASLQGAAPQPVIDVFDHTNEFTQEDVKEGRSFAMLCYLTGMLGIFLVFLGAKDAKFAKFHAKQALNIFIAELFCLTLGNVLCGLGSLAALILYVIGWIQFFSAATGKAKETPILRSMGCFDA